MTSFDEWSEEGEYQKEKSKGKTPEKTFFEKFPFLDDSNSNPNTNSKKVLPPTQDNDTSDLASYVNYLNELKQGLRDKDIISSTEYELPDYNNVESHTSQKNEFPESSRESNRISRDLHQFTSSETVEQKKRSNLHKGELEECHHKIESMQDEIKQYQNIINLLRLELKPYRNGKSPDTYLEIAQCQQLIHSLRDEIQEYKCKIESMQPEIMRYNQIIRALKSEIAEFKLGKQQIRSEFTQYQQLINSLRMEIAEYKNKISLTHSVTTQYENLSESLSTEITRLKNNLDSMFQME
jgi:chromosome segregation ATPase